MHKTEECKLSRSEPAKCVHCGEGHPANYKRCKVYQEVMRSRASPFVLLTANHQLTTNQVNIASTTNVENIPPPRKSYAHMARGDVIIPTDTSKAYVHELPKIKKESFIHETRNHTYKAGRTNEFPH